MTIRQEKDGSRLVISVEGYLDALTAPELEAELGKALADIDDLVFDLKDMEYTSSAGLRVLLGAQKVMDEKDGSMLVRGANELVMEIFEETGFTNILDIEE
ncbi:MAG: STAS domain-containing protein [Eubacterium sp.]|nr:STAS domain-containing protein [Eubacterium sp.]